MNSIFTRRSIRTYEDKKVEDEKIEKLLRAAMQAPSAHNQQPWEFVVVKDRELLIKLSEINKYAKMIGKASCAIIAVANTDRIIMEEYWQQDMAASVQNILLEAVELDLGAVWTGVAPRELIVDNVNEILHFPKNIIPFAVIAIGYSQKQNVYKDRYDESRVHYEKW